MHLPATLLLATMQCIVLITALPISRTNSLEAALHARQLAAYYNTDDTGALYEVGTGVSGTNTYRDADGVYHDIVRRQPKGDSPTSSPATPEARSLWGRAQATLLAAVRHENPKRRTDEAQDSQTATKRDVGEQDSTDSPAPRGVLDRLDMGERIYF